MYFDVRFLDTELQMTFGQLGKDAYLPCVEAVDAMDSGTVHRERDPDGWWFRFEGLALARATIESLEDPSHESVRPYRIFLHTQKEL